MFKLQKKEKEKLSSDIDLDDYDLSSGDELFNEGIVLINHGADPNPKSKPRAVKKIIVQSRVHISNCKCCQHKDYYKSC